MPSESSTINSHDFPAMQDLKAGDAMENALLYPATGSGVKAEDLDSLNGNGLHELDDDQPFPKLEDHHDEPPKPLQTQSLQQQPIARIQAYAKLEFPFFNFYIQKLSVTIGRRPPGGNGKPSNQASRKDRSNDSSRSKEGKAPREPSLEDQVIDPAKLLLKSDANPDQALLDAVLAPKEENQPNEAEPEGNASEAAAEKGPGKLLVDVDLGPIKAVSRDHARLFFDDALDKYGNAKGWSLEVRGRNGLVLNGQWKAKGEVTRLADGAKIQIAERIFYFILPQGVPYPSIPPSPNPDDDGFYGERELSQTTGRSASPVVYGSDSDELRSNGDDDEERKAAGLETSPTAPQHNTIMAPDGTLIDSVTGEVVKRRRGRPPKTKTAEQIAEDERRLDPTYTKRPRGRPPKHKKPLQGDERDTPSQDGSVPPEPERITKKQLQELKRQERERQKEEKAKQKEAEKQAKEAEKQAKKLEKEKADQEKKQKAAEQKAAQTAAAAAAKAAAEAEKAKAAAAAREAAEKERAERERAARDAKAAQAAQAAAVAAAKAQQIGPIPATDPAPHWVPTNSFIGRPDKPPYSHAALIAQAIYATAIKQATLQQIYAWIPEKYPYFRSHTGELQSAVRKELAMNRVFVNIPLQSGVALWALEPEQAKLFDGNTFLPPPTAGPSTHTPHQATPEPPKPLPPYQPSPSMSPGPGAVPAPTPAAPQPSASASKTPILISHLPPSYIKPPPPSNGSDPAAMLDPSGFPPIAIHEGKMFLSPHIFSVLTPQQLANLQTLDTKQALGILQAFVVNYFKTELKKKRKAEKAAAAGAAASPNGSGVKRPAEDSPGPTSKIAKVS